MTAENKDLHAALRKAFATPFNAVIAIEPEDGVPVWINGWSDPPAVNAARPEKKPADCTWRATHETLRRALESERGLENAYIYGRLAIAGDMSVMKRLKLEPSR